jgi:hypothetical protein
MFPNAGRWDRLKAFVAEWHQPLAAGDGVPEAELHATELRLGMKLPEALREWYGLAGRRMDLVAPQNQLLPPAELHFDANLLIFHVENQWNVLWGIRTRDLALPDPPVVLDRRGLMEFLSPAHSHRT